MIQTDRISPFWLFLALVGACATGSSVGPDPDPPDSSSISEASAGSSGIADAGGRGADAATETGAGGALADSSATETSGGDGGGGSGHAGGGAGPGGAGGSGGVGGKPDASGCTAITVASASVDPDYPTDLIATVNPALGGPVPEELWIMRPKDDKAGQYDLSSSPEDNYATCKHCVHLLQDLDKDADATVVVAGKDYFQVAGTMTVDTVDPQTQSSKGSLTGVILVEVTIDTETLKSTPVPGGACLSIDSWSWNTTQ